MIFLYKVCKLNIKVCKFTNYENLNLKKEEDHKNFKIRNLENFHLKKMYPFSSLHFFTYIRRIVYPQCIVITRDVWCSGGAETINLFVFEFLL